MTFFLILFFILCALYCMWRCIVPSLNVFLDHTTVSPLKVTLFVTRHIAHLLRLEWTRMYTHTQNEICFILCLEIMRDPNETAFNRAIAGNFISCIAERDPTSPEADEARILFYEGR